MLHRLGPYHLARLKGAQAKITTPVVALETSDADEIYAWDDVDPAGIEKITVFSGVDCAKLSRSKLLGRFREIFKAESPIAVFVLGWTHLGIAGILAANELGIPTAIMSESSSWDFSRNPVKEWVKRQVVGSCKAGLVGGRSHKDYLVQLGMQEESVFLGYDAIDNQYFDKETSRLRLEREALREKHGLSKPFFLASSRFVPKKNLESLFHAYSMYRANAGATASDLVCLGSGELDEKLRCLRKELQLESCIHMPGFIQYHQLPEFYAMANCLVHVSTCEQWGLVINEALASGLPAIVSEPCGAASELIQNGKNGWIVDPNNVEEIADRMLSIAKLGDDEIAEYSSCGKQIVACWGPVRFAEGFVGALQAALSAGATQPSIAKRIILRLALAMT